MGFGIKIEKIKDENALHYYIVTTNDFGGCTCYILIDAKYKQITFFDTASFRVPIETVSLEEPGYFKDVLNINKSVSNLVIVQAYKAVHAKSFPQSLSLYY